MSLEYLNAALKIDGLSPTAKLILLILANYADEKGSCYPSQKHLAKIVGLKNKRSVQTYIKLLNDLNLIRTERRYKADGGYTSNRYILTMRLGERHPDVSEDARVENTDATYTKDDTKENTYWVRQFSICAEKFFYSFWSDYKRKVGKHQAYKSFYKAIKQNTKSSDEQEVLHKMIVNGSSILDGLEKFNKENAMTEIKFIPHAATWLNQKRWLDYDAKDKKNKTNKNNLAG